MRLICLVFMLLLSPLLCGQEIQTDPADTEAEQIPEDNQELSKALIAIKDSLKAIASNTTPDEGTKKKQEECEIISTGLVRLDLAAQESMADSTKHIMWFTGAGVLIGLITVLLVYITFREARRATAAADRGADAAWESVKASRQIGEAQVRAYLEIEGCVVTSDPRPNVSGNTCLMELTIVCKNIGATPALKASPCIQVSLPTQGSETPHKIYCSCAAKDIRQGETIKFEKMPFVLPPRFVEEDYSLHQNGFFNIAVFAVDVFDNKIFTTRVYTFGFPANQNWKSKFSILLKPSFHSMSSNAFEEVKARFLEPHDGFAPTVGTIDSSNPQKPA